MLFLKKLKQCLKKNNMLNVGQHLKTLFLKDVDKMFENMLNDGTHVKCCS